MSDAEMILDKCAARGVVLTLGAGFTLMYDAPRGALSPELRGLLVEHKPAVVQLLLDREERAALMGAPEWVDAATFLRVMQHPAVLKLQSHGLCHEIVSVRPRRDEREAAA